LRRARFRRKDEAGLSRYSLMTNHPPPGLIDVFASTIPSLSFRPALHVNYAETVLAMRDGLPKFKDFPAEIGGSGEQMTGVAVFDLKLQQNEKQPRPPQ
jgi:hypothetical protein